MVFPIENSSGHSYKFMSLWTNGNGSLSFRENAVKRSCIAHNTHRHQRDYGVYIFRDNEALAQHQGSICKATDSSVFPSKEIIGTEMDNSEISALVCYSIYIRT